MYNTDIRIPVELGACLPLGILDHNGQKRDLDLEGKTGADFKKGLRYIYIYYIYVLYKYIISRCR